MHVVFVQHGDFRSDFYRISSGGAETFHAQEYSINYVVQLSDRNIATTVISVALDAAHDTQLTPLLRSIGFENIWQRKHPHSDVIVCLEQLAPTHLIIRYPSVELLAWAQGRGIEVLPSFADTFSPRAGLRKWVDKWRVFGLQRALNHPSIRYIGNHNIAACEALAKIGVAPEKIVPWDWPRAPTPDAYNVKIRPNEGPKTLIFVGAVSEAKGVGDILRALAVEPGLPRDTRLQIYGKGDTDDMERLAASLGIADRVHFGGVIPHNQVAPAMHAADAVVVYSQHSYSEGLPGTIFLGLAARTPLVVSDHPVFMSYVQHGRDVMVAPQCAPKQLAAALQALFEDDALYRALSEQSSAVFERLIHPVLWADFIERWLNNTAQDQAWLEAQSLPNWRTKAAPVS